VELQRLRRLDLLTRHATVRLEDPRRSELSKLMSNHILGHVDGNKDLTVMYTERMADEVGCNRGATGPSLDRLLGAGLDRLLDFLKQVVVDKETFLDGACHGTKRAELLLAARLATVVVDDDLRV
jgi:hypothetical protein